VGAVHVTRALVIAAVASVLLVSVQISIVSPLRIEGVVVMLVWLWPLALALTGSTAVAVAAGAFTGLLFDAHTFTPFGLSAIVGALLAWGISALAREGIADLDAAAWWMPPALFGAAGLLAPALFVGLAALTGHSDVWRDSLFAMMVVNALAFVVLARPVSRVAKRVARAGGFART
jgi:hypothetical protein